LVPPALSLRNEGEHVDRVRVEYRDPNDAGVSPTRGPALVFASCASIASPESLPRNQKTAGFSRLSSSPARQVSCSRPAPAPISADVGRVPGQCLLIWS